MAELAARRGADVDAAAKKAAFLKEAEEAVRRATLQVSHRRAAGLLSGTERRMSGWGRRGQRILRGVVASARRPCVRHAVRVMPLCTSPWCLPDRGQPRWSVVGRGADLVRRSAPRDA